MIIDAFTYYNETDVLRIRFEELYPSVDYFVVVEASKTFTGIDKPLYFERLPDWVDKFSDKIVRYIIDFPDDITDPWQRETYQRNQIYDAMAAVPRMECDATVIISDADEIPNWRSFRHHPEPTQLNMHQYFWKLNLQAPEHCNQGARPVMMMYSDMNSTSPQDMRASNEIRRWGPYGWHFSFLNAEELGRSKIEAFSHTEMNRKKFKSLEHMEQCVRKGLDPFERFPLKYKRIDTTYPQWVQLHKGELEHLLADPFPIGDNDEERGILG